MRKYAKLATVLQKCLNDHRQNCREPTLFPQSTRFPQNQPLRKDSLWSAVESSLQHSVLTAASETYLKAHRNHNIVSPISRNPGCAVQCNYQVIFPLKGQRVCHVGPSQGEVANKINFFFQGETFEKKKDLKRKFRTFWGNPFFLC